MRRPKTRRLGSGSWWATGHKTLAEAHVNVGALHHQRLEHYLDGLTIPSPWSGATATFTKLTGSAIGTTNILGWWVLP